MGHKTYSSEPVPERAVIVGVQKGRDQAWEAKESLDELAQLCITSGAEVAERVICRMPRPNPATYIGKGKATEIAELIKQHEANLLVFDDDLSPAQGRNVEEIVGVKVLDRTQLILDIFAQHARTSEGRMQIELAQLEYLLPRLIRMWTHLERQKGGIGLRGPGETQLESDRRRILDRIVKYKRDLNQVRTHRAEQRRGRRRHGWALISIVGYTNAGKSTLLNAMTGAGVLAENQLFATLDPTTRQLKLPNHQPALITDTVGFIRKLPHDLVESFKATLEEVIEADLLIHVIDASHPAVDKQIDAVVRVLQDLGVGDKPVLNVLNKIELPEADLQRARIEKRLAPCVSVSALKGIGLESLANALADLLRHRGRRVTLRIPMKEGRLISALRTGASIFSEEYGDDDVLMDASVPERLFGACAQYCVAGTHMAKEEVFEETP